MTQQIITPTADLKSYPNAGFLTVSTLPEGTLFTPSDSGWQHGTAAGHTGWFPNTALGPVGPSGIAMPYGDIAGWQQIFCDDFTTDVPLGSFPAAVNTRWAAYPDGWTDTTGHGTYMPSTVLEVSGHCLRWHIHAAGGKFCVSTPMPIIGTRIVHSPYDNYVNGQLYGRYAICMRSDTLPCYKTAFLLWPDSKNWPWDGEIDFPESNLDSGTMGAYMHRQSGANPSDQDAYHAACDRTGWHVFVIEWLANSLTFIMDGVVIGHSTARVPNTPMHWDLQAETALSGPLPDVATVGSIEVDWVSVYKPGP